MSGDHHSHGQNKKALLISFLIISAYMIVEAIGGYLTHSLALLSDAGHMLSDSISLGVGLLAFKFGERAVSESKTFGYKRFEILAALFNGVLLIVISLYILWEAYQRFLEPQGIASTGMLIVAIIGALVNIVVAWILTRADTSGNINMRAAFLHVLGDLLGSVGAIVAALLIMFFGWTFADPIASILVSLLIMRSGWGVTKDTLHVLMEGKPEDLDVEEVRVKLLHIPGVVSLHDFHVWSITSDFPSISCHLVVSNHDHDEVLRTALKELHDTFDLDHATIQVEDINSDVIELEHHCCNTYVSQQRNYSNP